MAGSPLMVQESVYDELLDRLSARTRSASAIHSIRRPRLGCRIPSAARPRGARDGGATGEGERLVLGGGRGTAPELRDGYFIIEPTIFGSRTV